MLDCALPINVESFTSSGLFPGECKFTSLCNNHQWGPDINSAIAQSVFLFQSAASWIIIHDHVVLSVHTGGEIAVPNGLEAFPRRVAI